MIALTRRPKSLPDAVAARSMSPVESWTRPCVCSRRFAWVPLPAPGGPEQDEVHPRRPRSLAFLISPSYWCASRCEWICATVSIVTLTTISRLVPPK